MEKYGMEKQENLLLEKYNLKITINFRINKDKKMNITLNVCYFVTINYLF